YNMRLKDVIFKDSIAYGVTMNLSIISAILLTPNYTRILSMGDYGVMDIFNTWNNLLGNILPAGLITIIILIYADLKTKEDRKKSMGTIFVYLLAVSTVFAAISIFCSDLFLNTIVGRKSPREVEIFLENIFIIVATIMFSFILSVLRARFSKYQYVVVSGIQFLILSILGYLLVCVVKTGFVGFYRASCIAFVVSLSVGFYYIRQDLFLSFDKVKFKELFSISIHYLSVAMLMKLVEVIGRYLLKEHASIEDIGIYSIGIRVASIIMFVLTSFATAWFPYSMSIKDNADREDIINKTHHLFYLVSAVIAVFILFFRKELIWFFAPTYTKSYHIIAILLFSNILSSSIYFYQLGINYTRQTKFISYGGVANVIVTLFMSFLLIKNYGVYGYAIASFCGVLVWIGVQLFYSQKLERINFSMPVLFYFILSFLAASVLPVVVEQYIQPYSIISQIALKFALSVCVLIPILVYTKSKYGEEMMRLFQSAKAKLGR
ncbi:MAG: oligosaccharide flippase family protein, partial [Chitinophagales bacterium]|nr:oligosaccharide flippase family protein [Chitinophagales bacterium]